MQLGEFVKRLETSFRSARYIIERGHVDRWVSAAKGSGNHLELGAGEAFALGLSVMLKKARFRMSEVEMLVEIIEGAMQYIHDKKSWEPGFRPFSGRLETKHRWLFDIGDRTAWRLATTADPSCDGELRTLSWVWFEGPKIKSFRPGVTIRIDISQLAKCLRD